MTQKVNWLLEKQIFDAEAQFLEALQNQGYAYKETTYLNFRREESDQYFPKHECVLFRGTLSLGRDILRTSWIPGAYMDEKNLRCSTYYTYFGQYLLNNKYFILSLGELIRRKEEILNYFNSKGEIFIRPDSNMKSFRAGVFNLEVLNTMQALGSELKSDASTLVLVSGKKPITKEWRFFVYKNEIVTGSLYLVGEEQINERIEGGHLQSYLSEVLKQVNWYPELLYTLDICESEGELYVLELGSFSCAGEYGCDVDLIVEAGAKAAWEDYEAVND
jgi:hypothetical protein